MEQSKRLRDNTYKIKDSSKEFLQNNGFHFSSRFSDSENTYYTYRFPVYKYKGKTDLLCTLTVDIQTKEVTIDVHDTQMKTYAPFYNDKYCTNNKVVDSVNTAIINKLKELNIKRT